VSQVGAAIAGPTLIEAADQGLWSWITTVDVTSASASCTAFQPVLVEIAGPYWHFVDIVWILIFTLVYLIPD
jgi:heme/copper-type cytochrome/quinol oxidase subunit 3